MLTQHASRKFKYYYEWFFCNEDNLLITELFHNENNYLLIIQWFCDDKKWLC